MFEVVIYYENGGAFNNPSLTPFSKVRIVTTDIANMENDVNAEIEDIEKTEQGNVKDIEVRSVDGGGGGADVLVGNALFVSSAGKTILDGAERLSLTNHFSDINEAVTVAQAGDTIYVMGGNHVVTSNLFVSGTTWQFLGKPNVLTNGDFPMFSDGGQTELIRVYGNANFRTAATVTDVGSIVQMGGNGSELIFNANRIASNGERGIDLLNVLSAEINIINEAELQNNGSLFQFEGSGNISVNIGGCLLSSNSNVSTYDRLIVTENFTGKANVKFLLAEKSTNVQPLFESISSTGTLTIVGDFRAFEGSGSTAAINLNGGNITHIGNAEGSGAVLDCFTDGNTFKHDSGTYNFSVTDPDQQVIGFDSDNNVLSLNGFYRQTGTADSCIRLGGTGNKYTLKNVTLTNEGTDAFSTFAGLTVFMPTANASRVILDGVSIYLNTDVGTPAAIRTDDGEQFVLISLAGVTSNVDVTTDIVNPVNGTEFTFNSSFNILPL